MYIEQLLVIVALICGISSDEQNHIYNDQEEVVVWMNSIGHYHNRVLKYPYFSYPFCSGYKMIINNHKTTLLESLQGDQLVFSGLDIGFKDDVPETAFCMVVLNEEKVKYFTRAVKNDYWFQIYIDGLSIWGKVGEKDEKDQKYYIYTRKKFEFGYNGKHIVDINLTTDKKRLLAPDEKIEFTYEVIWKQNATKFENRDDKFSDPNFFQHKVSLDL